jgi:hypothetical protein
MLCLFCRGGVEGRNHLFFEFSFCRRIWLGDLSKCLVKDPPYEWDAIVDGRKGKGLKSCFMQGSVERIYVSYLEGKEQH